MTIKFKAESKVKSRFTVFTAATDQRSLHINWMTVGIFLIAFPVMEVITYQAHLELPFPMGFVFGLLLVSYMALHFRLTVSLNKTVGYISAILFCLLLLLLVFGTGFSIQHISSNLDAHSIAWFMSGIAIGTAFSWVELGIRLLRPSLMSAYSTLAVIVAIVIGTYFLHSFLEMTARYNEIIADPVFWRVDQILGFDRLLVIAQLAKSNAVIHHILQYAYFSWFYILGAATWSEGKYAPKIVTGIMLRFLIAVSIGYTLYFIVPATGPIYYFGGAFPMSVPSATEKVSWVVAQTNAPRNCFPSLHATYVLLSYLAFRYSPAWQRLIAGVCVLLTFAATLGLGEHYAIDWFPALSLVLLVRATSTMALPIFDTLRWSAVGCGAFFLLGWVLIFRTAPESLSSAAAIQSFAWISFFLSIALEWLLAKAEDRAILLRAGQPEEPKSADIVQPAVL